MEGNSTFNNFTTMTISFKTEMIYEEVDIERTGKPDQGWYHLFTRTDRINQIDALIQPGIRGEDIILFKQRFSGTGFKLGGGGCG